MIDKRYIVWLYFTGVLGIVAGISLSKPAVTFGIFLCSLAWVLEGDFKIRLKKLFKNPVFIVSAVFYCMHLLGLLYSENLLYGLKDTKTKLPILVLPILFLSSNCFQLYNQRKFIFSVFILSLWLCCVLSFGIYLGYIKPTQFNSFDMRTMIFGGSGVRFAVFLVLAIFVLFHLFILSHSFLQRLQFALLLLFFLWFLNFTQSGTGIFQLLILGIFSIYYFLFQKLHIKTAFISSVVLTLVMAFVGFELINSVNKSFVEQPEKNHATMTKSGEYYWTDPALLFVENGHVVGKNIALNELRTTWSELSNYPIYTRDRNGQPLIITVIRYLNSKHLNKDKEGLMSLTQDDITNIENGIANVNYITMYGWQKRLHQLLFEIEAYRKGNSPFGNSLTQRFEYWRLGLKIVNENLFFGVGTGDVQDAFNKMYNQEYAKISQEYKLRAHNQYITFALSLGIAGFMVFLFFSILVLITGDLKSKPYLSWIFIFLSLVSYMYEDTLETQSGVTFIVFFTLLFVSINKAEADKKTIAFRNL